ncbi:MAG: hypothetical protein A3G24_24165 [Betaproteobacteria bacterium RIFCSPLOWO2_12_FULL_62_13]|nr:MAG: hypothetical protein A3G24_24165 [Betaproteobacteria bacterium RIFCSPLOWO2_12_FULL_62_13]
MGFVPFDPSTKRSEVLVRQDDRIARIVKGAPAAVAEVAGVPLEKIAPEVERLSAGGARVLAIASGEGAGFRIAGLVALTDPPRPDSAALIAAGLGLAALLFLLNSAVFWTAEHVLQLGAAETRTLVFVWLVFGVQAVIYVNRARGHFWTIAPGRFVALATLFDFILVTLLATQGWLMAAVPAHLVGAMLLLAAAFLIVADQIKVAASRWAAASSGPGTPLKPLAA